MLLNIAALDTVGAWLQGARQTDTKHRFVQLACTSPVEILPDGHLPDPLRSRPSYRTNTDPFLWVQPTPC